MEVVGFMPCVESNEKGTSIDILLKRSYTAEGDNRIVVTV